MPTFSYKIDSSDVYRQISNFRTFLLLDSGLATLACYLVHLQKEGSIKGEILLLYHHYAQPQHNLLYIVGTSIYLLWDAVAFGMCLHVFPN